jgi:hypothetical protein
VDGGSGVAAEVEDGADVMVADPGTEMGGVGLRGTIDLVGDDDVEIIEEEHLQAVKTGEGKDKDAEGDGREPDPKATRPPGGGVLRCRWDGQATAPGK